MNESKRTTQIIAEIKKRYPKWYVFKHVQSGMSRIGVPDILACIYGAFVGIEVKKTPNVYSEQQRYNMVKIIKAGGVAIGLIYREKESSAVFALDKDPAKKGSVANLTFTTLPQILRELDAYILDVLEVT